MDFSKYKKFRRIYPKLRLSWTLYLLYIRRDWVGIWNYLIGSYSPGTKSQNIGIETHEWIKKKGYKKILGIDRLLPIFELKESTPVKQEKKIIKDYDYYSIVSIPDLYTEKIVVDWKSGKMNGYEQQMQLYMWMIGKDCENGFLVATKPIYKGDKLKTVQAGKVFQYRRSEKSDIWENVFETIAQDIINNLKNFDKYLAESGCDI